MDNIFTPAKCYINLAALSRNFKKIGSPESVMPVIKTDGYGHGLLQVAHVLDECGAQYFAVGTVYEGKLLREKGFKQHILPLLSINATDEWQISIAHDITLLIHDFESLNKAIQFCPSDKKISIAIKFDTGMKRLGFSVEDIPHLFELLQSNDNITPTIIMSHLACADMPGEITFTRAQIERFTSICVSISDKFPKIKRSLANSAATLGLPETRYELCRPGLALYGGNPFAGTIWEERGKDLEAVMSVNTPILQIRDLKAGQSVSYGRLFTAPTNMQIAIIGAGYATGFARALSNNSEVLVNGQRAQQIGRVCMGLTIIDITNVKDVHKGDLAWIIGGQANPGERPITIQEIADNLSTIPYEILGIIGSTNQRIYSD